MKILAQLIWHELRLESNDLGHCAIYEKELQRIWPIHEPKIEQFAKNHGFRMVYYNPGLCTIFEEESQNQEKFRTPWDGGR
jgi:hypothetical protein